MGAGAHKHKHTSSNSERSRTFTLYCIVYSVQCARVRDPYPELIVIMNSGFAKTRIWLVPALPGPIERHTSARKTYFFIFGGISGGGGGFLQYFIQQCFICRPIRFHIFHILCFTETLAKKNLFAKIFGRISQNCLHRSSKHILTILVRKKQPFA